MAVLGLFRALLGEATVLAAPGPGGGNVYAGLALAAAGVTVYLIRSRRHR